MTQNGLLFSGADFASYIAFSEQLRYSPVFLTNEFVTFTSLALTLTVWEHDWPLVESMSTSETPRTELPRSKDAVLALQAPPEWLTKLCSQHSGAFPAQTLLHFPTSKGQVYGSTGSASCLYQCFRLFPFHRGKIT